MLTHDYKLPPYSHTKNLAKWTLIKTRVKHELLDVTPYSHAKNLAKWTLIKTRVKHELLDVTLKSVLVLN